MADGVVRIVTATEDLYIQDAQELGGREAARVSAAEVVEGGQVVQSFVAAGGEEVGREVAFAGRCSRAEYAKLKAVLAKGGVATLEYHEASTGGPTETWQVVLAEVDGNRVVATDWVDVATRAYITSS